MSRQQFSSLGEHLHIGHGNTYEIKLHFDGAEIVLSGVEGTRSGGLLVATL